MNFQIPIEKHQLYDTEAFKKYSQFSRNIYPPQLLEIAR